MENKPYNRQKAAETAAAWAMGRNPLYPDFDSMGGDCTNFISQCIYAGAGVMNFTKDTGWYCRNLNDRAAGWSGVEFLATFLLGNKAKGPFATKQPLYRVEVGDVLQLRFAGAREFGHSLMVVRVDVTAPSQIYVATHTEDALGRKLSSYTYEECRLLHIEGVNR